MQKNGSKKRIEFHPEHDQTEMFRAKNLYRTHCFQSISLFSLPSSASFAVELASKAADEMEMLNAPNRTKKNKPE